MSIFLRRGPTKSQLILSACHLLIVCLQLQQTLNNLNTTITEHKWNLQPTLSMTGQELVVVLLQGIQELRGLQRTTICKRTNEQNNTVFVTKQHKTKQ